MTNGDHPTLEETKALLERDGHHPVFLHIAAKKKGPEWSGWAEITHADTLNPDYLARLRGRPNTGILLGAPSDDLCAIDLDTESALEVFLEINPAFKATFRTRGARGAQLWAYVQGERPRQVHPLKVPKDSPLTAGMELKRDKKTGEILEYQTVGEFRAEGGQSVVRGVHPSGCHYSWLVKNPPITIAFDEIRWPAEIALPWAPKPTPTPTVSESNDSSAGNDCQKAKGKSESNDSSSDPINELLKRAKTRLSIDFLWQYFGYGERRHNPVASPFRSDNTDGHPSFSIYKEKDGELQRFRDHNASYEHHRGDAFDFFQLAKGQDAKQAFTAFVELAGLGDELVALKLTLKLEKVTQDLLAQGFAAARVKDVLSRIDQTGSIQQIIDRVMNVILDECEEESRGAAHQRGASEPKPKKESSATGGAERPRDMGDDWQEPGANDAGGKPQLILPSASVPYIETAEVCFGELAKTKAFFTKAGAPMEVISRSGAVQLIDLEPGAFQSRLEERFTLTRWIALPDGRQALKQSRCSLEAAKVLLKTTAARRLLPSIQIVTSAALFVESNGKIEVLDKGFHDTLGGTLVTKSHKIVTLLLDDAVRALLGVLDEWLFVEPSDKSRALAGLLSPALRLGGLLRCDFPLDLAEAEESQSGKTYRQHIIARMYGEEPEILNKKNSHDGGVGSIDENISTALLSGKPFLMFENVREKVDSQILESALRGVGVVQVRRPYSAPQQVSTDRIVWLLSSNKSEVTRDLANRTIVTRIQKQPAKFKYKSFAEGDLKAHVTAKSDFYLSCVLSVLRHWHSKGKPRTQDGRHDFREWAQTLDWIVQNTFNLPPLLDGHRSEQERISDPALSWLRDVALNVKRDNRLDEKFRPSEIVDICTAHGIEIPGCRIGLSQDQVLMQTGKTLKRIFREIDLKLVGGLNVNHSSCLEYNAQRQENMTVNYYEFCLPN